MNADNHNKDPQKHISQLEEELRLSRHRAPQSKSSDWPRNGNAWRLNAGKSPRNSIQNSWL
jgi:hypothetical protein